MVKRSKCAIYGTILGVVVGCVGNQAYNNNINEKRERNFVNAFDVPKIEDTVKFKKKVIEKKYVIDYYGNKIVLQDKNLKGYKFDKEGNIKPIKLDMVESLEYNDEIDINNYISSDEYIVYNAIKYKDNIESEYKIYLLFNKMHLVCQELLNRNTDDNMDRISYLYNISLNYIEPESLYTIGKYKFSELNNSIQQDIKKEVEYIKYINDNKCILEESNYDKFSDKISKSLKYDLFKLGK